MNAKEFLQQEINQTHTRGAAKDPNLFISRKYAVGLMEAYHRAKVEAVTTRAISEQAHDEYENFETDEFHEVGTIAFVAGAQWLRNKLLNQ